LKTRWRIRKIARSARQCATAHAMRRADRADISPEDISVMVPRDGLGMMDNE
jgi:hypothetical protein